MRGIGWKQPRAESARSSAGRAGMKTALPGLWQCGWLDAGNAAAYSKIRMAAAMVVVHRPRLSPTADWVTFAVRTILFEMR